MWRVDSLGKTLMLGGIGAGEGDDRGWDGWMASLTRWTWVWVKPGSWWWTGSPGVLLFMGSQRVRQDWATELNWRDLSRIQRAGYKILILSIGETSRYAGIATPHTALCLVWEASSLGHFLPISEGKGCHRVEGLDELCIFFFIN